MAVKSASYACEASPAATRCDYSLEKAHAVAARVPPQCASSWRVFEARLRGASAGRIRARSPLPFPRFPRIPSFPLLPSQFILCHLLPLFIFGREDFLLSSFLKRTEKHLPRPRPRPFRPKFKNSLFSREVRLFPSFPLFSLLCSSLPPSFPLSFPLFPHRYPSLFPSLPPLFSLFSPLFPVFSPQGAEDARRMTRTTSHEKTGQRQKETWKQRHNNTGKSPKIDESQNNEQKKRTVGFEPPSI